MTGLVVDCAADVRPILPRLKDMGVAGVMRYVCTDNPLTHWKIVTAGEVEAVLGAGLAIGINHEWYAERQREGAPAGRADAGTSQRFLDRFGIPHAPVTFSADWDARPAEQDGIDGYLDGTGGELGDDRGRRMYGGIWPLGRSLTSGHARHGWQPRAWSAHPEGMALPPHARLLHPGDKVGGQPLDYPGPGFDGWMFDDRAALWQGVTVKIGGVEVDVNTVNGEDWGQWPRPAGPYRHVVTAGNRLSFHAVCAARNMREDHLAAFTRKQLNLTHLAVFDAYLGLEAACHAAGDPRPAMPAGLVYWTAHP